MLSSHHAKTHSHSSKLVGALRKHPLVLREVLIPGMFLLAILISNYSLANVPNVKLFDLFIFAAGYSLGIRRGVTIACGAWMIYGNFNPWGPTTGLLLITVMASETIYAFAGSFVRQLCAPDQIRLKSASLLPMFSTAAIISTLMYDIVTNVYTGFEWALMTGNLTALGSILIALTNPGAIFFSSVHIASNVVAFILVGPLVIKATERLSKLPDQDG